MAVTVLVALIVLASAFLMGLTIAGWHRGKIGQSAALAIAMVLLVAGGSTMFYPSAMIVDAELIG